MFKHPPFLELVLISLLVACAPVATPAPVPAPTTDLPGTEWQLLSYGPSDTPLTPIGSSALTLAFKSADELNGFSGCNRYFGQYTVEGEALSISLLGSTEMACADEGLMQQESDYLAALGAAQTAQRDGDMLTLTYPGGALRYTRVLPPPPVPLEGTLWQLEAFEQGEAVSSVLAGTEITLTFADNKASGFSGCNWFSAEYSVDGSRLELGLIQQTVRACLEPGVEEQERAFAKAFRTVTEYAIDGDRLTLVHAGGRLHFRAASSP